MAAYDLHIHSGYSSDGELPVAAIVGLCAARGLDAFSLTDHNSVRGVGEAARLARERGIGFVPGIEIDCNYRGTDLHLLGYGIDWRSADFARLEEEVAAKVMASFGGMVDNLLKLGFSVDAEAVLAAAVLLLIPSVFGAAGTYINYDILTYLPPELDSMVGEGYLEDDFNMASTSMITVENMSTADTLALKSELEAVAGVKSVLWTSDILDVTTPKEMLPADIQKFFYSENGATLLLVQFENPSAHAVTMQAQRTIKDILRKDCFIGGMSAILEDTKSLVNQEMPVYILCAVGACLVVLFLSMKETVVPLIFMLGMVFPIVYNFGTNIFLGQISYITEALATVLQLGVTMDFSIFLLHRFEEEKRSCPDEDEAMVRAVQKTFSSILASSLTTIAGFLAMCTMRLTLGRDIGIVMAKGVLLGVVSTVTILPALILTFRRSIARHTHRTFIPKLRRTSRFVVRRYIPILAVFVLCFIPFSVAQAKTPVYYTLFDSLPQDLAGIQGTSRLKEDFGMTTSHFIIVDDGLPARDMEALTDEIEQVDGIRQVLSYEKFLGGGVPREVLPTEVRQIFCAGGHEMLLANSSYESGTEALNAIVKRYDPNGVITGEGAMTKDLIEVADVDFRSVSIASIAAVFLIIAISFRSASIPVLLVAAIESAIMINMGIPYFTGTTLPFVASIVIGTIQLGATVDYAILMTTRYKAERLNGEDKKKAVMTALRTSAPSIIVSGMGLFAATFGVAIYSDIDIISSMCMLMARGAIVSMLCVILILPALLLLCDRLVCATTLGMRHCNHSRKHAEKQDASAR